MIYDLEKIDLIITVKDNPMQLRLGISDEIQWEHHIEEHLALANTLIGRPQEKRNE